jgi:hypothetical protein
MTVPLSVPPPTAPVTQILTLGAEIVQCLVTRGAKPTCDVLVRLRLGAYVAATLTMDPGYRVFAGQGQTPWGRDMVVCYAAFVRKADDTTCYRLGVTRDGTHVFWGNGQVAVRAIDAAESLSLRPGKRPALRRRHQALMKLLNSPATDQPQPLDVHAESLLAGEILRGGPLTGAVGHERFCDVYGRPETRDRQERYEHDAAFSQAWDRLAQHSAVRVP